MAQFLKIFKAVIQDLGVEVEESTKIQIISVTSQARSRDGNALVVTSENGETMTKDVFLLVEEDGLGSFEIPSGDNSRSSGSASYPPTSWDGRYVVRATATYDLYTRPEPYYRPLSVSFRYVKDKPCTVNIVNVLYISNGWEYAYPGFTYLGGDAVEYVISVRQLNPVEGTTYSSSRPYSSNKVIGPGGAFGGQFLTFEVEVDGEDSHYTVAID